MGQRVKIERAGRSAAHGKVHGRGEWASRVYSEIGQTEKERTAPS